MTQQITDFEAAKAFVMAGNARFTIKSKRTGDHFTYKVACPRDRKLEDGFRFVSLLTGNPDDWHNWSYLGLLSEGKFVRTGKSKADWSAPSMKAFSWFWQQLATELPDQVELWHEGRCGKCGKTLTHPTSIETGLGPVCAGRAA